MFLPAVALASVLSISHLTNFVNANLLIFFVVKKFNHVEFIKCTMSNNILTNLHSNITISF